MPATLHETFRINLRRRLDELKMSQRELAEVMGVTEAYVSQVLRGRNVPKLDLVEKFCKPLRTNSLYLLTPVEIPEEPIFSATRLDLPELSR